MGQGTSTAPEYLSNVEYHIDQPGQTSEDDMAFRLRGFRVIGVNSDGSRVWQKNNNIGDKQ